MVNKHGLIMRGLKEACSETKRLYPYSGYKVIIYYDRLSGEIIASFDTLSTQLPYGPHEVHICDATFPLTMQEIADRIWERLSEVERVEQLYRNYEAYFSDLA